MGVRNWRPLGHASRSCRMEKGTSIHKVLGRLSRPLVERTELRNAFLSPEKKKEEEEKTQSVIQHADVLSAPAIQILEHFSSLNFISPDNKKFFHLKHFHSEPKLTEQSFGFSSREITSEYGGKS